MKYGRTVQMQYKKQTYIHAVKSNAYIYTVEPRYKEVGYNKTLL